MIKQSNYFLLLLAFLFVFNACQSPEQKKLSQVEALKKEFYKDMTGFIDRTKAVGLINAYEDFANTFPNHEEAAEFLFSAGDLAMNASYPHRAIEFYSRVFNDYPEYIRRPESLFLMAFVYENQLGDLVKAEAHYNQFLDLYPDNELADDAAVLLQNLGKSPEEIIREFEKMLEASRD